MGRSSRLLPHIKRCASRLKVPLIDFSSSELKPGSPKWELAKFQVRRAAEEYGCIEAKINRRALDIEASVFCSLKEAFALPSETKLRIACEEEYYRGYVGQIRCMPLFERIGVDDPTNFDHVQSFTNTLWPQGNVRFSKAILHSSNQLLGINKLMTRMILESFGVEKHKEDQFNSTNYTLRLLRYDKTQTSEKMLGLAPHTDKGLMTILFQNSVHGFELQTRDGRWIDVKPSPDSLIVLFGESYHVWTNGRLYAPYHLVMSSANEERYSIGLVSYPKLGYVIKAPEELVDEAHPSLYRPLEFCELLKQHSMITVWMNKQFANCSPVSECTA